MHAPSRQDEVDGKIANEIEPVEINEEMVKQETRTQDQSDAIDRLNDLERSIFADQRSNQSSAIGAAPESNHLGSNMDSNQGSTMGSTHGSAMGSTMGSTQGSGLGSTAQGSSQGQR